MVVVLASFLLLTPQPLQAAGYDLSTGFSSVANPNSVWSFGWKQSFGSSFNLLTAPISASSANGVPLQGWMLPAYTQPAVYANQTTNTGTGSGGWVAPPGAVFVVAGLNGRPENYCIIRFTAPSNDTYAVGAAVAPMYTGALAGDTDFHVLKNGVEIYGQFLAPHATTSFTNDIPLAAGEVLEFAFGRGADGSEYGSSPRIAALITPASGLVEVTNPPPPVVSDDFDLSRDFSATSNPSSAWSFGWKNAFGSAFNLLTYQLGATTANGVPEVAWALPSYYQPAVYHNPTATTGTGSGGWIAPPGAVYVVTGVNGRPENYAVIRFTAPSNSNYDIRAAVAPMYTGGLAGDVDFHVLKNGSALFDRFMAPHDTASFSNVVALDSGDTLEFAFGRGADGNEYGSSPRIAAVISATTNASTIETNTPPPPPPPVVASDFDLERDYSSTLNPNGAWSFGWKSMSGSTFNLLTHPLVATTANGVPEVAWALPFYYQPAVYHNPTTNTGTGSGGWIAPPGAVYVVTGVNGRPENLCVIRFTAPSNSNYAVGAAVAPMYTGGLAGDVDFHVLKNGSELFGRFMAPHDTAAFSNVVALASGDTLEFAFGRGADGNEYGSSPRIAALISATSDAPTIETNTPPPPPPPVVYDDYNLARDFDTLNNPAGAWSFGWKGTLGGAFSLLTGHINAASANGVPLSAWALPSYFQPAVYANQTTNTGTGAGGWIAPPRSVWVVPGWNGRPENYCVIRFTAPSNSNYQVGAAVAPMYTGALAGDSDFHVVRNGVEIFGRFLAPHDTAGFSNVLALAAGDTLEFAFGRGADGNEYGSSPRIAALITPTTNDAVVITNPPPVFADNFDLGRDFSATLNPAGAWTYGWKSTLEGGFYHDTRSFTASSDNGVPVAGWAANDLGLPAHYCNITETTAIIGGGQGILPPRTFWMHPGQTGRPENFGAVRFTAPSNANYLVETRADALYSGYLSGDTDYHVVVNGVEVFGQPLPARQGTGWTNIVALSAGDTLDLALGRGADGNDWGAGLKIAAVLTPTTNGAIIITNPPPPPPPPPPVVHPDFNAARDFAAAVNPAGVWSYGWKGILGGEFTLDPIFFGASSENGVAVSGWAASAIGLPALYCNTSSITATLGGGQSVLPPGTMWFHPGADGRPENFGALRFTAPSNGNYRLETAVDSLYSGGLSGDTDFHVVVNGAEVFGQFLPAHAGTSYTNLVALASGDTVDFAIGRGADGHGYGAGLKLVAILTPTTNAPVVVTNPPPVAPTIVSGPPPTLTVNAGAGITLTVVAAGTAPLSWQWLLNGVPIPGETSPLLNISSAQTNHAGTYHVVVSNSVGVVTNSGTVLTVVPFNVGTVIFANLSTNRVYDVDGETLAPAGGTLMAGLYVASAGGDFVMVGAGAPFIVSGRFNGGTMQVPGTTAGQVVSLQVRVWDSLAGATYEAATTGKRGSSTVFQHTLGGGVAPPSPLHGMAGFALALPGLDAAPVRNAALVPPVLRHLTRTAAGWAFMMNGSPGVTYAIESSVDLVHWKTTAYVVPDQNGVIEFVQNDPTVTRRFFRARLSTE